MHNAFTIDVEDWFHILDDRAVPKIEDWDLLESRVERNIDQILELLHNHGIHATFFWLGWLAERHKSLLRRCCDAGHEIASHSYNHVSPHKVGPESFKDDIDRAKKTLEDIIGKQVFGFRVPGFGIRSDTRWAFDIIKKVGYQYDSSVFPAMRVYNGMAKKVMKTHIIHTETGPLVEVAVSAIKVFGFRLFFFGGGYLRLAPLRLIQWGVKNLHKMGLPLIVYVHPREVDQNTPRLPLSRIRYFKSYVNLKSTVPKLQWLCKNYSFIPLCEIANEFLAANI